MTIKSIKAKEVLDSNNKPTIKVILKTSKGEFQAMVPSGTSTGKYEAHAIVASKAVNIVNKIIARKLIGLDPSNQSKIDNLLIKLDGTKNKSKLGANAILGVSMAICRAGAAKHNLPLYKYLQKLSGNKIIKLPIPMLLLIEGGKHISKNSEKNTELNSEKNTDIQEFMILPKAKSFKDSLKKGKKVYKELSIILRKNKYNTKLGLEGAYTPVLKSNELAIELIEQAIQKAGFTKNEITIAIDSAASEFYKNNLYYLEVEKTKLTKKQFLNYYINLVKTHNITSIEDPFDQDDWKSWQSLTKSLNKKLNNKSNKKINIVGDDLLVTNIIRIKQAIKNKACNTLLLKINQIGTITESLEAYNLAKSAGFDIIVSHRSGETLDSFIADLSVGLNSEFIKIGSPSKPERLAKYNRLLKIEEELK